MFSGRMSTGSYRSLNRDDKAEPLITSGVSSPSRGRYVKSDASSAKAGALPDGAPVDPEVGASAPLVPRAKPQHSSLKRVISLAKPEVGILVIATIALFVATAATVAIPQFFGQMIDDISNTHNIAHLNRTLVLLAIVFSVGAVATFIRAYCFTVTGEKIVARLRTQLFVRIQAQEIGFFDGEKTGELINRQAGRGSASEALQNFGGSLPARLLTCAVVLVLPCPQVGKRHDRVTECSDIQRVHGLALDRPGHRVCGHAVRRVVAAQSHHTVGSSRHFARYLLYTLMWLWLPAWREYASAVCRCGVVRSLLEACQQAVPGASMLLAPWFPAR